MWKHVFLLFCLLAFFGECSSSCCPKNMSYIPSAKVCIDKYEASVVDVRTLAPSSPNYNPNNAQAQWQWNRFVNMTVPGVPMPTRESEYYAGSSYVPLALSQNMVFPQAYVDRPNAVTACASAGKRLCNMAEWRSACRGPRNTTYPYGNDYIPGACNAGVPYWPPGLIGRSNNWEMLDPRIAPLPYPNDPNRTLRSLSGAYVNCTNEYQVFDMVGNMAEIVADETTPGFMTFVGGFYARTPLDTVTCDRAVQTHAAVYNDYSIGFRCCTEPKSCHNV